MGTMFDKRCRAGVERSLRPVGSGLKKAGITADQLTVAGLVISAATAVAVGGGWLGLGAFLLALSAVPDVLDGAVAKASGTASPRGSFFDSVADRVSDSLVLGGFAWYLASVEGAHAALLPMAVMGTSGLVSYERAKAESLGFSARGGLMERAERMLALGACLVFSVVMVPILWLMLVLTGFTAVHRFVMVWQQATASRPGEANASPPPGRWRGWTPTVGLPARTERREPLRLRARRSPSPSGTWRRSRTRP
jgi:CDP-diacylglycerol---glycerol-3-phosphate 3-phosphatidyltransferase